jgi:TonB family protein
MPTLRRLLGCSLLFASCGNSNVVTDPNAIVDISQVSVAPVAIHSSRPDYPVELRKKFVSGNALIHLVVRRDGGVTDVKVIRATDPLFGVAGANAVSKWIFRPAKIDGRPVNCSLEIPITFTAPPFVMTSENVLVSVSAERVTVTGSYRFHVIQFDLHRPPEGNPVSGWLHLAIPIPEDANAREEFAKFNAVLTFHGVTIRPDDFHTMYTELPRIEGVKFDSVDFSLGVIDVPEIEVVIKYSQPVVRRAGRLWAYYVSLIEGFEYFERDLGLKGGSYGVSFEAAPGVSIKANGRHAKILQSTARLISFEAHDREVLDVEILPNRIPEPPLSSVTSPAGSVAAIFTADH